MEDANPKTFLNLGLTEEEFGSPKNHTKIKKVTAIVCIIIIATIITLLIGHFEFNWFQNQTYKIDSKLSRNIYQTNYFTETKIINSRVDFSNGISEAHEQKVYTNFMVIQTDRKELENNDFLNTATLVILDANATFDNATNNVISFNIFNESKIKEFKSNPDGDKYPMAIFSFNENGTVVDIQLPNNMSDYNAHCIIELIENVVPKLSKNKSKSIVTKAKIADKNKKTLFENQSPKEIGNFKGSRLVKSIEMDVEWGKLTNIRVSSKLSLQSQNKEEQNIFGLKDFQYDTKSEIISTGTKEEKDNIGLVQNLAKYYTFIESKELLQLLADEKKQVIDYVREEREEDVNYRDIQLGKSNSDDVSKTFTIKQFEVLGLTISMKATVGRKEGKAFCQFILDSEAGTYYFGPKGVSYDFTKTEEIKDITILNFQFPPFPELELDLKVGGSLTFSYKICPNCDKNFMDYGISGSLTGTTEIVAGKNFFVSVKAGAKGTICSAGFNGIFDHEGHFSKSGYFSGGAVTVYVNGKLLDMTLFDKSWDVWDGWSYKF